ncbi:MAG: hypothetical protein HY315_06420 [Acidobacteria bacterium]|nr:hypothetical protein [Acidobacteriota bacterium]
MNDTENLELEENTVLTENDRAILNSAAGFHGDGLALKKWWEEAQQANGYTDRFDSVHTLNRSESSFAFFGEAPLERGKMPVMGLVDDVFYDRPKAAEGEGEMGVTRMKEQIREFALRYFLRVSDYRQPERLPDPGADQVPPYLRPLSWRAEQDVHRSGMEFTQRYYKSSSTGRIGKFPSETENAVVDMREIGRKYDWIILKLKVFDFTVTLKPTGNDGPQFLLPLKEESYLLVSPEFITDRDDPEPGIAGEYGFGYAFLKNPSRGPFAYGPGEFEAAFQTINFRVLNSGEIRVRMPFVSNRPDKITHFSIDPVGWSISLADRLTFGISSGLLQPVKEAWSKVASTLGMDQDPVVAGIDLANLVSLGQSAKQLDITVDQLNRGFLVRHSMQHYTTLSASLRTWRQIPDWLSKDLPDWVVAGTSS